MFLLLSLLLAVKNLLHVPHITKGMPQVSGCTGEQDPDVPDIGEQATQNLSTTDTQDERQLVIHPVKYIHFSRNDLNGTTFDPLNPKESRTVFDIGLRCVFVTHGWNRDTTSPSVMLIVRQYLEHLDYNLVAVDWGDNAKQNYVAARASVDKVGMRVGEALSSLIRENICEHNSTKMIGHSLGGHMAGVAGHHVEQETGRQLAVIWALDPAGPLYQGIVIDARDRLDPSDAFFVGVIHSDPVIFGYRGTLGDADFYPNCGQIVQPNCTPDFCSHMRAFQYYAESIGNPSAFLSTRCTNCQDYNAGRCEGQPTAHMGEWTEPGTSGSYYLTTKGESPYSYS